MATFRILKEVNTSNPGGWALCFQFGIYQYDMVDANAIPSEAGYRFIWRRPNGQLQGARGQARLEPAWITILLGKAAAEGWYPVPPPVDPSHTGTGNYRTEGYFSPGQHQDDHERLQKLLISDPRLRTYGRVGTGFHGPAAAREYCWIQSLMPIPERVLNDLAAAANVRLSHVEYVALS